MASSLGETDARALCTKNSLDQGTPNMSECFVLENLCKITRSKQDDPNPRGLCMNLSKQRSFLAWGTPCNTTTP